MILMLCLYFQHLSINVSIFTLVVIALDRYRGILWPLKGGYSKFRAKIHLMIVWFLATVVALPNLISFHVSQDLVSFRPARRHMPRLATSSDYIVKTWGKSGRSGFNGLGLKKKVVLRKKCLFPYRAQRLRWLFSDSSFCNLLFLDFQLDHHPEIEGKFGCIVDKDIVEERTWRYYTLVAVLVQYCVPLSVITFCHCHMAKVCQ